MIINIFRIGTDQRPATNEDIENFKESLQSILDGESNILICNHAIEHLKVDIEDNIVRVENYTGDTIEDNLII